MAAIGSGRWFTHSLVELGWGPSELASRLGCAPKMIYRWKGNATIPPDVVRYVQECRDALNAVPECTYKPTRAEKKGNV